MITYGDIPTNATHFTKLNYSVEAPRAVHSWQFSTTFNRWSALVTFEDGWHGYTYPANHCPIDNAPRGWFDNSQEFEATA